MPPDHPPIPPEALPPGWGAADSDDGRVAYRLARLGIELAAIRTEAERSHPSLGIGCCWKLQYRLPIGDLSATETIGRVSTRHAALEGLLECMHQVHDGLEAADPAEIHSILQGVSLDDVVPDGVA